MWGYLVILICISLVTSHVEHLMYLLVIYMSSMEKCLFRSSVHKFLSDPKHSSTFSKPSPQKDLKMVLLLCQFYRLKNYCLLRLKNLVRVPWLSVRYAAASFQIKSQITCDIQGLQQIWILSDLLRSFFNLFLSIFYQDKVLLSIQVFDFVHKMIQIFLTFPEY